MGPSNGHLGSRQVGYGVRVQFALPVWVHHAWEPRSGFKVTFIFSVGFEEASIAELVLVSLVWQSKYNSFRSLAFNANDG